ncbi:MAG: YfiR family protein, partial [Desulfobacterales bacterium]|nr:YfiR family protein [Desulfobacterales bacterium]
LYNFINFITWPDEAFGAPERPFTIGVLGEDPFGSFLEKVVASETFRGGPIMLARGDAVEGLAHCQILFIGKSNRDRLDAILKRAPPKHVLTVGDFDGFIDAGGMINLVKVGQRVRIEINTRAVGNAGLGVSSKLLRVAKIVSE